jgi:hypothetical protein
LHFDFPFYDSWWKEPNLGPLSESLRQLLKNVKVLRVRGVSKRILELLSHCTFDLHQLDMCGVVASEMIIKGFFETSKKSIRSIGATCYIQSAHDCYTEGFEYKPGTQFVRRLEMD